MNFDIFNNDAFSLVGLSKAIVDTPFVPGRVGELGIFTNEPIATTSVALERVGTTLSLVSSAPRGSQGKPYTSDKRSVMNVGVVHLPQRASIVADEVQNIRAFGTDSELETAQKVMNKKLAKMRRDIDATLEWQRIGAIKGQILDADGTTVLADMNTLFGLGFQTQSMVLGTAGTNVRDKLVAAKRKVEAALGGLGYSGLRVLCSPAFMDTLCSHSKVEAAYANWSSNEFLRTDHRAGFNFAQVTFEEYRGAVGGNNFITDGDAWMIPEGVPELFTTYFGPADYMETVNTLGLPYYAKQEMMDFNKGIMIEAQSNPISICTRPNAIVKLTVA